MRKIRTAILLLIGIGLLSAFFSCKHEIPTIPGGPGTGEDSICFESDVLPIFQGYCAKSGCHDAVTAAEGYILDSYSNIVSRGLQPGNAANSKIYEVLNESGDDRMPQPPNEPLSSAQISLIAQWINEGARNTTGCAPVCDSSNFTYSGGVRPILQTYCLGCHNGDAAAGGFIPLGAYVSVKDVVNAGLMMPAIDHTGFFPMPKNGAKLSDCKIAIIRKWIEAGAPEN